MNPHLKPFKKHREIINTLNIVAADGWEYTNQLQAAYRDPEHIWETSEKNEHFPYFSPFLYTISLVEYEPEVVKPPVELSPEKKELLEKFGNQEGAAAPVEVKKRGPKPKSE